MNIGKMRSRIEICRVSTTPGDSGEPVTQIEVIHKCRGNYRTVGGKEFILSGAHLNSRSGTLQTRYYKDADESLHIRINKGDIYQVDTFNHDERMISTVWTISKYK